MAAYEEIVKLKELLDSGVITRSDFYRLKDKIVSGEDKNPISNNQPIQSVSHSNKTCASCSSPIGFTNRYKLKDGTYVCKNCLKKAGFNTLPVSLSDGMYLSNTVTLDTLFSGHEEHFGEVAMKITMKNAIMCPDCFSHNVQFMQQGKKGFSVGKAVGGAVLTGGIGTLAGFAGKKGKKEWFCLDCKNVFTTKK